MTESHPLQADLDEILERSREDIATFAGSLILITGGTGFVGSWLLESIAWANARSALGIRAFVLTRDPGVFRSRMPHLAATGDTTIVEGDVRSLPAGLPQFDAVIHAATPASADINRDDPSLMLETIVDGGRCVLDAAAKSGAIPVLLTSSGAVYGPQPPQVSHLDESYAGGPNQLNPSSAYHEGKRVAELQCAIYAKRYGILPKIARMYAFVGPYLPLDRHFAIGNFIRDGLNGDEIRIAGDGTAVRSYLYAAEMTIWLWSIFVRGQALRPYNLGSERAVSIAELSTEVAACFDPAPEIRIAGSPDPTRALDRYVPSTQRARTELDLEERVTLRASIERTIAYHRSIRRT